MAELRIAVLVSIGRHPVSGAARWSRNDAAALGLALAFGLDTQPEVIHVGSPDDSALRDYLALGAATVEAIAWPPGDNVLPVLAARLRGYDLVLCGTRAEGGEASGLLPYLLSEALGAALLPGAIAVGIEGRRATVRQFLPKGRRRDVTAPLPVVVTVHPLAPSSLRYAYARQRAGRILPCVCELPASPYTAWTTEAARVRPRKLVAPEKRSGHARMLSATTTESRGGRVIQQGTPHDKAQAVLAYLREHGLIDY